MDENEKRLFEDIKRYLQQIVYGTSGVNMPLNSNTTNSNSVNEPQSQNEDNESQNKSNNEKNERDAAEKRYRDMADSEHQYHLQRIAFEKAYQSQRLKNEHEISVARHGQDTWAGRAAVRRDDREAKRSTQEYQDKQALGNQISNIISTVVSGATQIAEGVQNFILAGKRSHLQEGKNVFEKSEKIFQAEMELSNTVAQTVITTISSFATQRATDASKAIAKTAYSEANAQIKYYTAMQMAQREYDVAETERKNEEFKGKSSAVTQGVGGVASILGALPGLGGVIGGIAGALNGAAGSVTQMQAKSVDFNIEQAKQENEIYQQMMNRVSQVAEKMQGIVSAIDDAANAVMDAAREAETSYKHAGMVMGFRGDQFSSYMRNVMIDVNKLFPLSADDLKSMQTSYENTSGRSKIMSSNDYIQMESIGRVFGVNNSEISSLMGEMNIFNTSITDGYHMMDLMYRKATKLGLSTSKFSKDLVNNLKLAQKYNFKGGVDNMAKLTLWAEKTRFNLQNTTNFADKLMSNNISEVLETSAKLQVLGGNAAIYADPMAMMWEAGNDVGALAKRQSAMFGHITGSFNSETGETTFTESDLRMIKAISDAAGMNYEDVLNQKRQSNKQGVINQKLKGFGLNEDELNGIGQRALYDKQSGQFMVDTISGQKMSIEQVAAMSNEERSKILMPANEEDAIMNIARDTRSLNEKADANLKWNQARAGANSWDLIEESSNEAISWQTKLYDALIKTGGLNDSIIEQQRLTKEQTKSTIKNLQDNQGAIKNYREFVSNETAKSHMLDQAEVSLLTIMASNQGMQNISTFSGDVAKLLSSNSDKQYNATMNRLKKTYANSNDPNMAILLNMMTGAYHTNQQKDGINFGASYVGQTNDNRPVLNVNNSKNIHPVNDAVIGHPRDGAIMLAKGDGALVNAMKSGKKEDYHLTVNGNLTLTGAGVTADFMQVLKTNPILAKELLELILREDDRLNNGRLSKK